MKARLYLESHVTFEKPDPAMWSLFSSQAEQLGFRASRFDVDEVDHYDGAWFLSARCQELDYMKQNIANCLKVFRRLGFKPIRWKIEDTLMDSKHGDLESDLNG